MNRRVDHRGGNTDINRPELANSLSPARGCLRMRRAGGVQILVFRTVTSLLGSPGVGLHQLKQESGNTSHGGTTSYHPESAQRELRDGREWRRAESPHGAPSTDVSSSATAAAAVVSAAREPATACEARDE
jgi:hypothetical protein